ncbi:hypothetical protein FK531_01905 [Rhodococcus spelaei]|uniref:TTHB210-like domain-containing protein n=1 Tax=Rhodococcus spelaei TaxID=2546320 RepID=A0A541BRE6_9NOCA|nr:DUF5602 domain-containing protein [Rhodococcus spelaei]TQF74856.1 hypothetical protein FK531_01905 [Rhodococcus spelaei]
MHASRRSPTVGLTLAVCASLSVATGCMADSSAATPTWFGPAVDVGGGTARSFVTLDENGTPAGVGIRLSASALDGLTDAADVEMQTFPLELPDQTPPTAFEYVTLDWNPHGHGPLGLFAKPHFDMHFYMIDASAVDEIDPARADFQSRASKLPPAQYMPVDYIPTPGPPEMNTSPKMGLHWANRADGMIPGLYNFDQAVLAGSWDGAYTFTEPMMTRQWLQTRPTLTEDVRQPQAYAKSGYYPTTYSVTYDDAAAEYVVELAGMQLRQAS